MNDFFSTYGFMIAMLSFATAMAIVWLFFIGQKRKLFPWWGIILVSLSHSLFAFLAMKIFGWMESGFRTFGSLSLFGSMLFLPLFYVLVSIISKKSFAEIFDCMTPCLVFGLICCRINCLHAGCCLGQYINGVDGARYPTREIEIAFHVIIAIALMAVCWKRKARGMLFPAYLTLYGIFRFICEFFREQTQFVGSLHLSHIWALIAIGVSLLVLVVEAIFRKGRTLAND